MEIIVIVVLVVVLAGAALFFYQRQRSGQLQNKFGPEYDHAVEESGDKRTAERDLRERERRVAKLDGGKKRELVACVNTVLAKLPVGKKRFVIEGASLDDMAAYAPVMDILAAMHVQANVRMFMN